jgi:hypothetical protein
MVVPPCGARQSGIFTRIKLRLTGAVREVSPSLNELLQIFPFDENDVVFLESFLEFRA